MKCGTFLLSMIFLFVSSIGYAQGHEGHNHDHEGHNHDLDHHGLDINHEQYAFDKELHHYYEQMQLYILDKSAEPMPDELKNKIEELRLDAGQLSKEDVVGVIRQYWTFQFVEKFGQSIAPNELPNRNSIFNGGFENEFLGYNRYDGYFNDHFPKCNPMAGNNPVNWLYLNPIPSTYPNDYPFYFEIVDPGYDPNILQHVELPTVKFGEKAVRINDILDSPNNTCGYGNYGINKLTKDFVVDEETSKFVVWYAVVLQDPSGHISETSNDKPFFNIQFFDDNNILVEELCWDSTEDFFIDLPRTSTTCGNEWDLKVQPWRCSIFDLSGYEGQNMRLDITTADCGKGAHFGYAYVDGMCEYCASIEISGGLSDCPCDVRTVCGTFDVENSNTNYQLENLTATVSGDDGSSFDIDITNINYSGQSFCFDISPDDLTEGVCYDVTVTGIFVDGLSQPLIVTSSTIVTGDFNDFCVGQLGADFIDYSYDLTCDDNGTAKKVHDDKFSFVLDIVTSLPTTNWEVRQNGWLVIASGDGSQTISLGPFDFAACNSFEIYLPDCDESYTLDLVYDCDGCTNDFRVCGHEIICDDNGTTWPGDDMWSITLMVESQESGGWSLQNPPTLAPFNTLVTLDMGELNNYGSSHTFKFRKVGDTCGFKYTVDLPENCNKQCNLDYDIIISECYKPECQLDNYEQPLYDVLIDMAILNTCPPSFYIEINESDWLPLDPSLWAANGYPIIGLNALAGTWTLIIEDCNGCFEEVPIYPPSCEGNFDNYEVDDRSNEEMKAENMRIEVAPVPTSDYVKITPNLEDINYDLEVYDLYGNPLFKKNSKMGEAIIDFSAYDSGIYIAVIKVNGQIVDSKRLIKI